MEQIGHRLVMRYLPFTDIPLPLGGVNVITVLSTLLTLGVLGLILCLAVRRITWIPGRSQVLMETAIGALDGQIVATVGAAHPRINRMFLPWIASLFLFILACNAIVLLPIPDIEEPTGDLNTTLALAMLSVGVASWTALRFKGARGYFAELCGPMWHQENAGAFARIAGKLSALFFLPLRVSEEFSRVISLACRLFGNIMGAGIVIAVMSTLGYYLLFPLALDGFFLVFESLLQAYVFSMLTLVYIAEALREE